MSEEQNDPQAKPKLTVNRKQKRQYYRIDEDQPTDPQPPVESKPPTEPQPPAEPKPPTQPQQPILPDPPAEPKPPAEPQQPALPEPPVEAQPPAEPKPPTQPQTAAKEPPVEPQQPIEPESPIEPEIEINPEPQTGPETTGGESQAADEDVELLMPQEQDASEPPPKVVLTQTVESAKRESKARALIKEYTLGSSVVGLTPVPLLDIAVVSVFQTKMLMRMAAVYEAPIAEEKVRMMVGSLVSSASGILVGSRLLNMIPVVGRVLRPFSSAISSGAATYALGIVFMRHFESGGDLLNPSVEKYMARFEAELERSREAFFEQFDKAAAAN